MMAVSPNNLAANMIWIEGATFNMGSDQHYPEEAPKHSVHVDGFWIDAFPVTNAAFQQFVTATNYRTTAEIAPQVDDYPGIKSEMLYAGSLVFHPTKKRVELNDSTQWWRYVRGANWRAPRGAASNIDDLANHPVVHVSYTDAIAYATWAGKQLPTEAEWELAAKGCITDTEFAWGDTYQPDHRSLANTWQGEFPWQNTNPHAQTGTSPVGAYPANSYGLFDMIGNVWEWTDDFYAPQHAVLATHANKACCIPRNPRGARAADSIDPAMPDIPIPRKVLKGGSYLCAPNYCRRYRPAARLPEPIDTSTNHVGFRCVLRNSTANKS